MTSVVSTAARSPRHISVTGPLKDEISHWLFRESWDGSLPRRDEDHFRLSIATDSSASGWGGLILHPIKRELSHYWTPDQIALDISAKEAIVIHQVLEACKDILLTLELMFRFITKLLYRPGIIMIRVHGVPPLTMCLSAYFFTTVELNVLLHLHYVCIRDNPADLPSRHLSTIDSLKFNVNSLAIMDTLVTLWLFHGTL